MKKHVLSTLLSVVMVSSTFVSCEKEENPDGGNSFDAKSATRTEQTTFGCSDETEGYTVTVGLSNTSELTTASLSFYLVNDNNLEVSSGGLNSFEGDTLCTFAPLVGCVSAYTANVAGEVVTYFSDLDFDASISINGSSCDVTYKGDFINIDDSTDVVSLNVNETGITIQ